jgi:hypothetical protein
MSDLDVGGYPAKPSETQPSAWHAHPSIWKIAFSLWGLVVACAVWAALATLTWYLAFSKVESSVPWESWTFFPLVSSRALWLEFSLSGGVTVHWWTVSSLAVVLVQGPLTLELHCSELIVNVIRDERQWRYATGRNGLRMTINPLKSFFTDPLVLVLFVPKPALRESFALGSDRCPHKLYRLDAGLSFHLSTTAHDSGVLRTVAIGMYTAPSGNRRDIVFPRYSWQNKTKQSWDCM